MRPGNNSHTLKPSWRQKQIKLRRASVDTIDGGICSIALSRDPQIECVRVFVAVSAVRSDEVSCEHDRAGQADKVTASIAQCGQTMRETAWCPG